MSMSMQEKGRKHRTDGQNFYESGGETLAPACGHIVRHKLSDFATGSDGGHRNEPGGGEFSWLFFWE